MTNLDKPSGLTKNERNRLADLMNKPTWTAAEKRELRELKAKLNY